jgi:hypothetical protein
MAALNKLQQSTDPSSPADGRKKKSIKPAEEVKKSKDPSAGNGGQSIFYKDMCIMRFDVRYA